jgi:purine-binding chemotaxis protein CheW
MDTFLIFMLGNERFAAPVTKVLEVLQKQVITRVPKTPPHILGIINFRGEILPVYDTGQKFNQSANRQDEAHIVIVYEIGAGNDKISIAATADSVKDVIEIKPEEIKPVPELGLDFDSSYIAGAIRRDEAFILMLDIEKVFSMTDISNVKQNKKTEILKEI